MAEASLADRLKKKWADLQGDDRSELSSAIQDEVDKRINAYVDKANKQQAASAQDDNQGSMPDYYNMGSDLYHQTDHINAAQFDGDMPKVQAKQRRDLGKTGITDWRKGAFDFDGNGINWDGTPSINGVLNSTLPYQKAMNQSALDYKMQGDSLQRKRKQAYGPYSSRLSQRLRSPNAPDLGLGEN